MLVIASLLAACTRDGQPSTTSLTVTATAITSTVISTPALPTANVTPSVAATPIAEASSAPNTPAATPTREPLEAFRERLKALLMAQDWENIELVSAETLSFGTLPYQIFEQASRDALGSLQYSYLTDGSQPVFSDSVPDGIDPVAYYMGNRPIASVLYGTGLGIDKAGDGLIYIVESGQPEQPYAFGGIVLSYDQFAQQLNYPIIAPPEGVLFTRDEQLWRIEKDGSSQLLFERPPITSWTINPQGTNAVLFNPAVTPDAFTLLDLTNNVAKVVPIDDRFLTSAAFVFGSWLDERTAVIGLHLGEEEVGPNMGHLALLDANSGAIALIDEIGLLTSPPAVASNSIVWSTFEAASPNLFYWQEGERWPIDAQPLLDLGVTPNDSSAFSPALDPTDSGRIAWWVKGIETGRSLVIVDGEATQIVLSVTPPPIGGFPPAAMWSPDGAWLAFDAWTNMPSQDGVYLYNTITNEIVRFNIGASSPQWVDDNRLIYLQQRGAEAEVRLYDIATGETAVLEMPDDAFFAGYAAVSEPTVQSEPLIDKTTTIEPSMTASRITFDSWSPDSRYAAVWVSSAEDIANSNTQFPNATLQFYDAEHAAYCPVAEMPAAPRTYGAVVWRDDGRVAIQAQDDVYIGVPCESFAVAIEPIESPEIDSAETNRAFSPNGQYLAESIWEGDVTQPFQTFTTTLYADAQPVQSVTWQIDTRIGNYATHLGGEWVSPTEFLIYETFFQGPLLLSVDGTITSVGIDLLGLERVPTLQDDNYSIAVRHIPDPNSDNYYLLTRFVGSPDAASPQLYRSADRTTESLDFSRVVDIVDGWLVLNQGDSVDGYERNSYWRRPIDDRDAEPELFAEGVDGLLRTDDSAEFIWTNRAGIVTWQDWQTLDILGQYQPAEPFSAYPRSISPDGRHAALLGNNVPNNFVTEALFFVEKTPEQSALPPSTDGLLLRFGDTTFIIREGERERLTIHDARRQRISDGVGFVYHNENLYTRDGGQLFVRTANEPHTAVRLNSDYFYQAIWGVVGDWLIVSGVPHDEPPSQTLGSPFAVSLDGATVRPISDARPYGGMAVAPDGSRFIYHDTNRVYAWYPDSSQEQLSLPVFRSATISPDSRYIALDILPHQMNLYDLQTIERIASASEFKNFSGDGFIRPIWNPNSTQIAFGITRLDEGGEVPIGTSIRLLSLDRTEHTIDNVRLGAFAPDGGWLAVSSRSPENEISVHLVNLETFQQYETPLQHQPIAWVANELKD